MRVPLALVLSLIVAGSASAASITIDMAAAFNAATGAFTNEGTEDFESSTLGANSILTVDDPLTSGVANGVFTAGLTAGLGLTVQSNTGGMPGLPSPRGVDGLVTASAFFSGTPTDQVSNNANGDSFDMLFGLADTVAVSFNPLVFDANATDGGGDVEIRVYDTSDVLLASLTAMSARILSVSPKSMYFL